MALLMPSSQQLFPWFEKVWNLCMYMNFSNWTFCSCSVLVHSMIYLLSGAFLLQADYRMQFLNSREAFIKWSRDALSGRRDADQTQKKSNTFNCTFMSDMSFQSAHEVNVLFFAWWQVACCKRMGSATALLTYAWINNTILQDWEHWIQTTKLDRMSCVASNCVQSTGYQRRRSQKKITGKSPQLLHECCFCL
jgi:hypothetical protein